MYTTKYSTLSGTYTPATTGYHELKFLNWRSDLYTTNVVNYIDNISVSPQNPSLEVITHEISVTTGGTSIFNFDAGTGNGGLNYFTLSNITGPYPGMTMGGLHVHLNWDIWTATAFKLVASSSPAFYKFKGVLDANGKASGTMNTFGSLPPTALGIVLYFDTVVHASAGGGPFVFATNPGYILFIP